MVNVECPHCQEVIQIDVVQHLFDHVMYCNVCYTQLVDYIFSEFVKDGFAMNSSFIRQSIKYMLQFMDKKFEELGDVPNEHL